MKFTIGKLAATGVAVATAAAIAMPVQAAEELKMSTALGQKHDQSKAMFATFAKEMKKDESVVKLNYIGGPEVTPNRKQGAAMKRGLIDIIMSPTTYYANLVPEARLTGSRVRPRRVRFPPNASRSGARSARAGWRPSIWPRTASSPTARWH